MPLPRGAVKRGPIVDILALDVGASLDEYVDRARSVVIRCQENTRRREKTVRTDASTAILRYIPNSHMAIRVWQWETP